mgnify:CR=1 FL=1
MRTQLLCTFAHRKDLDLIIDYISKSYTVSENRMFVFANAETDGDEIRHIHLELFKRIDL